MEHKSSSCVKTGWRYIRVHLHVVDKSSSSRSSCAKTEKMQIVCDALARTGWWWMDGSGGGVKYISHMHMYRDILWSKINILRIRYQLPVE